MPSAMLLSRADSNSRSPAPRKIQFAVPSGVLQERFNERVRVGIVVAAAIVLPALAARLVVVLREPDALNRDLSIFVLISEILVTLLISVGFYARRLPLTAVQPAAALLSLFMIFGACLVVVQTRLHWPTVAVVIVIVGAANVLLSWRWFAYTAIGGSLGLLFSVASIETLGAPQWIEIVLWLVIFLGIAIGAHWSRIAVYTRIETLRWRDRQSRDELTSLVAELQHEVSERRVAESEVRKKEEVLRQLTRRLLTLQEMERSRISRELHDELGQILSAINMQVLAAKRLAADDDQIDRLDECSEMTREAIEQIRKLSTELRPSILDDFGLETALKWIVERQTDRAELPIVYESTNGCARFPLDVEAACFRIAQEAITNAVRHSKASSVRVSHVCQSNRLTVRVQDDGVGFDPENVRNEGIENLHLGLMGMRERAELLGGRLAIQSAAGQGASVEVQFERPSQADAQLGDRTA